MAGLVSVSRLFSCLSSSLRAWRGSRSAEREDFRDAFERDHRPCRAIVQLIAQLIDGFLQLMDGQQDLSSLRRVGPERGALHVGQIMRQKFSLHPAGPPCGPGWELAIPWL